MSKDKVYESIGSGSVDDWMERERRYEARHSPWDLDDNASYLDEEHRRHCEAKELRKHHEQNCEVPRPDYSKYEQPAGNQFVNPAQQFREMRQQLRKNVRAASPQAGPAGKSAALFFAIVILIFFMFFVSMFIQILLRF